MNHPDGIERLEREEALIKLQEIISQTRGVLDNIGPKKIETLLLTGSWALLASGDYGTTVPVHKKSDVDFLSITIEPDICYKEITSIKQRLKEVLAGITGISDPVSIEGWSYSPEWTQNPSIWTHGVLVGGMDRVKNPEALLAALQESGIKLIQN